MERILTICVPSFNRINALDGFLGSILNACESLNEVTEVLFVDDGYDKKSVSYILEKYNKFSKFKYHKNPNSGSFGSVYAECLSVADSEFILITNDDDILFPDGILKCINKIKNQKDLGVVSPVWLSNANRVIRGNKFYKRNIRTNNTLRYTAHAPGLIFCSSSIKSKLPELKKRLLQNCVFTSTYPQVFLSTLIVDDGKYIQTLDIEIGKDGHELPTEIKSPDGEEYFSLKSRLLQYYALLEIKDLKFFSDKLIDELCWNFLARIVLYQKRNTLYSIIFFVLRRRLIENFRNVRHKLKQSMKGEKSND
tara:strand:- start:281 stop:1207 length:927 start_codon:yes stop_codon:yes gene_type:complete